MKITGHMKIYRVLYLSIMFTMQLRAMPCPPALATPGFGIDGSYTMVADTFESAEWKKTFYFFRPDCDSAFPLLLLCPGFNADGPREYEELIRHWVSRGNSVLYVPARRATLTRNKLVKYDLGMSGICEAVHGWKQADTTRVGIIGHGYGGGATPALMRLLRLRKWGEQGAFMYIMSPWYLYAIEKRAMAAFPPGVNLVVQTFENDRLNDPRIAADIYSIIGIPPAKKLLFRTGDFITDTSRYKADFTAPFGDHAFLDSWNPLDVYAIARVIDAAALFSFTSDRPVRRTSFNHAIRGVLTIDTSAVHVKKPFLKVIDNPRKDLPRGIWVNQWNSPRNPRLDASVIRKGRKIYFRFQAKKIQQLTRYLVKEVEANVKDEELDSVLALNPIDSGFGADGTLGVKVKTFPNPVDSAMTVSLYYPDSALRQRPVILFLHGYNNGKTEYFSHLINHIVSNGYTLIFSPYPTFPTVNSEKPVMEKYVTALAGFTDAVDRFPEYVDTTRIGIFGQSFGAGGIPWITKRVMVERGWGKTAAFLFISAPWYTFGVTQADFEAIPAHVKLLLTTYDDDVFNDHQMAVDIFRSVRIPKDEKCYITFFSDTLDSVILPANHFVPYGSGSVNGVEDNFDFFGIFRLFDALAEYTFTGDAEAKRIALGKGSPEQCYMGLWPDGTPVKPAVVSTDPYPQHGTLQYMFSWENRLNPRRGAEVPEFPRRKRWKRR
jgi:hypothetical protein